MSDRARKTTVSVCDSTWSLAGDYLRREGLDPDDEALRLETIQRWMRLGGAAEGRSQLRVQDARARATKALERLKWTIVEPGHHDSIPFRFTIKRRGAQWALLDHHFGGKERCRCGADQCRALAEDIYSGKIKVSD